jgi:hypothetical protein
VLVSYRKLIQHIGQLSEAEVLQALHLEANSRRRKALLNRLIVKAAELNRRNYIAALKEKTYHGKS